MKKITFYFCLSLLLLSGRIHAQRFANEWIVPSQTYAKLTINQNGIYRVTKSQLDAIGFQTSGKNPQNLKLFFRGIEMAIKVVDQTDGVFNDSDFIEFYAIKNDGKQDEEVYIPKTARLNKYVNMYCDNTNYFLTFGNSAGKRLDNLPLVNSALTSDPIFNYTNLQVYDSQWNWDANIYSPLLLQSYFEPNEGLVSNMIRIPNTFTGSTTLANLIDNPADNIVNVEFGINDRKGAFAKIIGYNLNSVNIGTLNLTNWETKIISLPLIGISNNTISHDFKINSSPNALDAFSMMYLKYDYPRKPIYMDNDVYQLIQNPTGKSKLTLSAAAQAAIGFDITDFYNQKNVTTNFDGANNIDVYVDGTDVNKKIYLAYVPKAPSAITLKTFKNFTPSDFDYLLLTDTRLMSGATNYKAFRESVEGSNYKVLLLTMDELYDQFCYGERNPIAIKRFADFMLENSTPKALFLLGRAYSFPTDYKSNKNLDFVPTFGYPASDIMLTSGLKGNSLAVPSIPTGRLVVTSNQQINDYIAKSKEFECCKGDWQKNLLKLAGPKITSEYTSLPNTLTELTSIATASSFAASTTNYPVINKPDINTLGDKAVPNDLYTKINAGVGVFTYYGHGNYSEASHNFGYVSKETYTAGTALGGPTRYTNKCKYPFLYLNGCGIANSFKLTEPSDIASDWVNAKDRGAIVALSQSYLSYELADTPAMKELYSTWFGTSSDPSMIDKPMGEVVQKANQNFLVANPIVNELNLTGNDPYYFSNLTQSILLGDPAISILGPKKCFSALRVNLLDFIGIPKISENQLTWKSSSEDNFKGFEIEKSTDLNQFEKIGYQEGIANNNLEITNYSFDDKNPNKIGNYYRLKLIDLNGKFEYSKIIYVLNENKNKLIVFGNPVSNQNFQISLNEIDISSLNIFDAKGSKINFESINIGKDSFKINIKKGTPKGLIILNVQDLNKALYSEKLILE